MPDKTTKRPTHTVRLLPAAGASSDAAWPFVGAAWENRDGSFNIVIDNDLPSGSRIQLKKRKEPAKAAKAAP